MNLTYIILDIQMNVTYVTQFIPVCNKKKRVVPSTHALGNPLQVIDCSSKRLPGENAKF